jgi:hypothetical protein
MTLKEFALKWGLEYTPETLYNVRTGAAVESGYIAGKQVIKDCAEYTASFIERLSRDDKVLALQYRDDTSCLHKDFDPENEEQVKAIIKAVMGEKKS